MPLFHDIHEIAESQKEMVKVLVCICEELKKIAAALSPGPAAEVQLKLGGEDVTKQP